MSRSSTAPLVLHLPARSLPVARSVAFFLRHQVPGRVTPRLVSAFRFKNDERPFALRLLARKPNLWIFRSNQFASCGDFVVVDMSSPDPSTREVWVLDLKQGARLQRGGGGAGDQLRNVDRALSDLARRYRVVPPHTEPSLLVGDSKLLLAALTRRPGESA
ncbi:MAG: hypothetical protein JKY65_04480 [Planctomycetes bacterium]|nr:hypothetical protein [Planctomycetota bacterium]